MKNLSILLTLLFSISVANIANAWRRNCDEAIVILAKQNLTPEAKKMVKKYLGKNHDDDVQYLYDKEKELRKQKKLKSADRKIHDLHLTRNFQPKNTKGKDAYKGIVEAMDIVRNRKLHSKEKVTTALRVIINLMCDMHNFSKTRIDGYPHSYNNFQFTTVLREWGPKSAKIRTWKWRDLWGIHDGGYRFFSAKYWAEDMKIYLGDRYAEYSSGALEDWVAEIGAMAAHYLDFCKPDARVPYMEVKYMGVVNYDQMIKASCRLAAILNEVAKK